MKISRESILRYAHGDSIDTDPLKLATIQSGWAKCEITITLVPLMLPRNVTHAHGCSCECRASCVSLSCICQRMCHVPLSVPANVVHRVCP